MPSISRSHTEFNSLEDDQGRHSLNDGDSTRDDARVVTAAGSERPGSAVVLSSGLRLRDGRGGLESETIRLCKFFVQNRRRIYDSPEVDVLSVGDTTLDSSRPVGNGAEASTLSLDEGVVVARPGNLAALEARADLEALGGRDREHSVCKCGFQLVEARLTKT